MTRTIEARVESREIIVIEIPIEMVTPSIIESADRLFEWFDKEKSDLLPYSEAMKKDDDKWIALYLKEVRRSYFPEFLKCMIGEICKAMRKNDE